jgi:uncharacterized protein Yka (UPF0111/DUF47 family)
MKTQILAAIGEKNLQPMTSVNAALAANDRIKFGFSMLQMALSHAEHPDQTAPSLKQERIACGIDEPDLDDAVAGARMIGSSCHMQGAARLLVRIADDVRLMAAPVLASNPDGFAGRLGALMRDWPVAANDLVESAIVSAITQLSRTRADSLHQLVVDLHKQLNVMQTKLADERIDGAAVYGLSAADRPLVSAFMKGLNRTAKLKFSHPGLATTATRAGADLVIQNDLGTTDAHVIVIHVREPGVTVTYTDVHRERLAFFQRMLIGREVAWGDEREASLGAKEAFYLASGRCDAKTSEGCADFLEYLGSRLVFLIDWNRARKQLRGFLRGQDRLVLLDWAAQQEIGHCGFLELGGARPVNLAVEASAGSSMHFGDRLCDVLSDDASLAFLQFVFRSATEGILADTSRSLLHDRIRVCLASHFSNEAHQLLGIAGDHAGLVFEIASLAQSGVRGTPESAHDSDKRAGRFEHDADLLVAKTRDAVRRRPDYAVFVRILEAADDAADALEDAVFLLQLESLQGKALEALGKLADLLVAAAQEWIKALGHASQVGHSAAGVEIEDFLSATNRVTALEHEADHAERGLAAVALAHARDFRQLHLFNAVGIKLGSAADALKHSSLMLREHVLEDVLNG